VQLDPQDAERTAGAAAAELDRYDAGEPGVDLDGIVAALEDATDAAPDHPEVGFWWYCLGTAHARRAADGGPPDGWDAGVDILRMVLDGTPDPEPAADLATDLALLLFRRFYARVDSWDHDEASVRCHELRDDLVPLAAGGAPVTMIRGLVRLDLYRLHRASDDRSAGLALLAEALPELAADEPLVAEALGEYAIALDDLADEDEDAATEFRDRAITALSRAFTVLPPDARPDLVLLDARLCCSRGYDADDVAELRRGLERFARYVAVDASDDPELPFAWLLQARARERLWYLTKEPAERDAVIVCCDTALALGLHDDVPLDAHRMVLELLQAQVSEAAPGSGVIEDGRTRMAAAIAELDGRPGADTGARAEMAYAIAAMGCTLIGSAPGLVDVATLQRFADLALAHPDPPYEWELRLSMLSQLRLFPGYREPPPGAPRLPEIAEAWPKSEMGPELHDELAVMTAFMAYFDAFRSGDRGQMRAAEALLAGAADPGSPVALLVSGLIDATIAYQDGASREELAQAYRRVVDAAESSAGDPWTARYILPMMWSFVAILEGRPAHLALPGPAEAGRPDALAAMMDGLMGAVGSMAATMGSAHDPDGLRRVLWDGERELAAHERGSVPHQMAAMAQAVAAGRLAQIAPGDPAAAEAAICWGTEAVEAMGSPEHPLWAERALELAAAHRRRRRPGDLPRSREIGFDALRGNTWQALLQTGTDHAVAATGPAADTALRLAQWCADDGAPNDLVRAVEAGRGLALHAATTTRSVTEMLAGLGRDDLAAEWAAAGGADRIALPALPGVDLHGDLRQRVLRALLAGRPAVLDPPGTARIRAALHAQGADALVYLVPGADGAPGRAVAVPAAGDVEILDLPRLATGPGSVIDDYATAYEAWHAPAPGRLRNESAAAFDRWSEELLRLVRWAWGAAADRLLGSSRRWAAGGLPRLVLVPVGMLALVPWHAASRPVDGRRRHLVEDAVVSYAASARLFCDVVDREPVTAGKALIVGNPAGNLFAGGLEAQAVQEAFHPDADYLGMVGAGGAEGWSVAPGGAGTPDEVLDRLAASGRPCPLVHFACHARADATSPSASRLQLGGRAELRVGALMERAPTGLLPLGTVVLAACSTNVAGGRHDEAFSISTAFLAAGARTAVGSLWTVPDGFTSRLMFVLHHHLAENRLPPADAVRAAQLWMLDHYRDTPETMPDELFAVRLEDSAYEHPVNWAGLTHLGR